MNYLSFKLSQCLAVTSRLYVVRGNPINVFPRLFTDWRVFTLTFEADIEPYAKERDQRVEDLARTYGVKVIMEYSHTIYNPEVVLQKNLGHPPLTFKNFTQLVSKIKVAQPFACPSPLPANSAPPTDAEEHFNSECYNLPTLSELGVDSSQLLACLYPGGETTGLARMREYLSKTDWICTFEKPNTSPNSLEPSTTVLSPYLKFGCLSSRLFYTELCAVLKKKKKHSEPPVSLLGQLLWREFYYTAAASEPKFDRMVGNSICRQIPWQPNDDHLAAWTHGRTGYPFIDAVMRQLRQEGWIHHLARHAVACFLTRGDLWISWEEGQKVFEELLLDADWALNAGNWMWLSASAFFYQYFRVYSPVAFGKKTDKDGKYIRKYVPELAKFPTAKIYEPWKASKAEQTLAKCVIGVDYPQRIVAHETVSERNKGRMAEAYREHHAKSAVASKFPVDVKPTLKIEKEESDADNGRPRKRYKTTYETK